MMTGNAVGSVCADTPARFLRSRGGVVHPNIFSPNAALKCLGILSDIVGKSDLLSKLFRPERRGEFGAELRNIFGVL